MEQNTIAKEIKPDEAFLQIPLDEDEQDSAKELSDRIHELGLNIETEELSEDKLVFKISETDGIKIKERTTVIDEDIDLYEADPEELETSYDAIIYPQCDRDIESEISSLFHDLGVGYDTGGIVGGGRQWMLDFALEGATITVPET